MRHFPLLHDRFEHQFGIRAIPPDESILERTDCYDVEVALKRRLLEEDKGNYFSARAESDLACREAIESLSPITSSELGIETRSLCSACPASKEPLLDFSVSIQEDLIVLSGDEADGHPIMAGVVCFPSGWCIAEKIGKPITEVHEKVPEYASHLAEATNRLLARLKPGRPVWRMNWGVRSSSRLDQSPKHSRLLQQRQEQVSAETAGERCYFRVERQTLSRLPQSGAILFTIHTHQCRLGELTRRQRVNLLGVLRSCPDATLRYKGILPIAGEVTSYLQHSLRDQDQTTNGS